jgi:hypothetical protein
MPGREYVIFLVGSELFPGTQIRVESGGGRVLRTAAVESYYSRFRSASDFLSVPLDCVFGRHLEGGLQGQGTLIDLCGDTSKSFWAVLNLPEVGVYPFDNTKKCIEGGGGLLFKSC